MGEDAVDARKLGNPLERAPVSAPRATLIRVIVDHLLELAVVRPFTTRLLINTTSAHSFRP
jgi:hypothetical protein